jgi:predicted Zn-dependent peptidase
VQVALAQAARSNSNMADLLSSYQSTFGDWRNVIKELRSIQNITADELQAAAQDVFVDNNSFEALVPRSRF